MFCKFFWSKTDTMPRTCSTPQTTTQVR